MLPVARRTMSLAIYASALALAAPISAQSIGDKVPDTFICTMVPGPDSVTFTANQAAAQSGGRVLHTYTNIFSGFALRIPQQAVDALVENNPLVSGCVQAQYVGLPDGSVGDASRGAPGPGSGGGPGGGGGGGGGGGKPGGNGGGGGESTPWGVALVGSGAPRNGAVAYVVDTGVDNDAPDLNIVGAVEYLTAETFGGNPNSTDDLNGHGTHVAGTIGAIAGNNIGVVGVAPGAPIFSVRVLDSLGVAPDSDVAAGLDFVLGDAAAGDVVNLSLTADPGSTVLNAGVTALAGAGVLVVMAAGNDGKSVDGVVAPAYLNGDNLFTVSAVDKRGNLASFSNYGSSVDWAEPGVNILSLAPGGSTTTKDGTSMAAPHLSGILMVSGGAVGDGGAIKRDKDGQTDHIGILP